MPFELLAFEYHPRTRLVFGNGSIERIGEFSRELSARKVLIVTDQGIVAAGHLDRVHRLLEAAHIQTVIFDRVKENPTTLDVNACFEFSKAKEIDTIVGLGGGSSMDVAKGCNFLLTNGGCMMDYWGKGKATKPMLPLIAVPTTAGTGSECQSFALIADETTHQKMACGDPKAAACVAILDPGLTLSQPKRVTACTGIDAIAHAVETAVTRNRTKLSLLFAREAFKLAVESFPKVLEAPSDVSARGEMQLAAAFAGTAIENSMLGAAHSAANPLTARYGIIHGQAVGLMLPHVVRWNGRDTGAREGYAELAANAGLVRKDDDPSQALEALVARLEHFLNLAEMPRSLDACGVRRSDIQTMAQEAAKQWTAQFNPSEINVSNFEQLYQDAFNFRGDGDCGEALRQGH